MVELYQKFLRTLESGFVSFSEYLKANPRYAWLFIAIVFAIFAVGCLFGKNWAVTPAGQGYRMRWWYNLLGHRLFAKILMVIFFFGSACALVMFFIS